MSADNVNISRYECQCSLTAMSTRTRASFGDKEIRCRSCASEVNVPRILERVSELCEPDYDDEVVTFERHQNTAVFQIGFETDGDCRENEREIVFVKDFTITRRTTRDRRRSTGRLHVLVEGENGLRYPDADDMNWLVNE